MTRFIEAHRALTRAAALVLSYALATALGGALFVALMHCAPAILGPGVMFYRGVGALALVFVALMAIFLALPSRLVRGVALERADSIGAATVATSLLTAAFVLGPVTVDRSVSVFMLSQFDAADHALTEAEARDAFRRIYVDDWAQIDRRLKEQELSGNLQHDGAGWRLTEQGRAFMGTARLMSSLFKGDPRFVGRRD
ncbi:MULTISPECIES: hypothetical protein [Methylosinus]|uniref:Uncharacterized protein n=1 Tax=Methylosinus trichosporium (strain ATCC 35070 / NCIMB 11131 / UNIQEM 75 / OB3b) TaxID=595536 RepID=A0A2D2D514_METT3|nr:MULTISPECIES: hypothetical protein [Methylosinus]ATQ70108.1 hypothetical protein CQW49_21115 [Methylosinus trichosporium OB3b]OBS52547.1 hypothetical protein A8B73_10595 [Methylosinus sp. 3S-1]